MRGPFPLAVLVTLGLFALLAAYVRLAPDDPARWHRVPAPALNQPVGDGVTAIRGGAVLHLAEGAERLAQLGAAANADERTRVVAGSVAEGWVTWVTRSALWGFPDYTTAQIQPDGTLAVWARLRYGGHDLGVNAKRLRQWLGEPAPAG